MFSKLKLHLATKIRFDSQKGEGRQLSFVAVKIRLNRYITTVVFKPHVPCTPCHIIFNKSMNFITFNRESLTSQTRVIIWVGL